MLVVILDYNTGNIGSLSNILDSIGVPNKCSNSNSDLCNNTYNYTRGWFF